MFLEFFRWKVSEEKILNRTGRWFLTIVNLTHYIPDEVFAQQMPLTAYNEELSIEEFKVPYSLRTWTSGCYYFNEKDKAWVANGMVIREAYYATTHCRSDHLTTFATGFLVIPNSINFDYIFANASLADNLTIYICVIVTLVLFLILLIWSR